MIHFTDLTGLAGIALALASMGARAARPRSHECLVLAVLFVVLLLPLAGLPLAAYVRGMVGDLSITSVVLLAAAASGASSTKPDARGVAALLIPAVAACVLYPMALGATRFDPYQLGYGEPWFLAAVLAVALMGHLARLPLVAVSISLAVLAWSVGWYESSNLWDYLIDPLLAIYVMARLLILACKTFGGGTN